MNIKKLNTLYEGPPDDRAAPIAAVIDLLINKKRSPRGERLTADERRRRQTAIHRHNIALLAATKPHLSPRAAARADATIENLRRQLAGDER